MLDPLIKGEELRTSLYHKVGIEEPFGLVEPTLGSLINLFLSSRKGMAHTKLSGWWSSLQAA